MVACKFATNIFNQLDKVIKAVTTVRIGFIFGKKLFAY